MPTSSVKRPLSPAQHSSSKKRCVSLKERVRAMQIGHVSSVRVVGSDDDEMTLQVICVDDLSITHCLLVNLDGILCPAWISTDDPVNFTELKLNAFELRDGAWLVRKFPAMRKKKSFKVVAWNEPTLLPPVATKFLQMYHSNAVLRDKPDCDVIGEIFKLPRITDPLVTKKMRVVFVRRTDNEVYSSLKIALRQPLLLVYPEYPLLGNVLVLGGEYPVVGMAYWSGTKLSVRDLHGKDLDLDVQHHTYVDSEFQFFPKLQSF